MHCQLNVKPPKGTKKIIMKTTFCDYILYFENEVTKVIWFELSPIDYMRIYFKRYYPNAIGFRRVYHNLKRGKYYKL